MEPPTMATVGLSGSPILRILAQQQRSCVDCRESLSKHHSRPAAYLRCVNLCSNGAYRLEGPRDFLRGNRLDHRIVAHRNFHAL